MDKSCLKGAAKGVIEFSVLLLVIAIVGSIISASLNIAPRNEMPTFNSCGEMALAFKSAAEQGVYGRFYEDNMALPMTTGMAKESGAGPAQGYSTTNVQVEGVDEADIVKTDGKYIYTLTADYQYYALEEGRSGESGNVLVIADAYPAEDAEVLSITSLGDFQPSEIFIDGDRLLIFGTSYREFDYEAETAPVAKGFAPPYTAYTSITTVQIWDITDRSDPEKLRTVDFEGDYLTSRKIGSDVYFVLNSYPRLYGAEDAVLSEENVKSIIPVYNDSSEGGEGFRPICGCAEVAYFEPMQPESFMTIASISMSDEDADVKKEVIVGSGQNVYASLQNLYVAETVWPQWGIIRPLIDGGLGGEGTGEVTEKTIIHKFSLDGGNMDYEGNGEVAGHILNQFSMDEHDGYFRIATTAGRLSRSGSSTSNNIYVLDAELNEKGKIEDIAPGESIYSARFMGERGYLVTFKKVDPFFVIDLSDPANPQILGKLKIPGYSDYLHPYDENHIIGIGKETVEADEDETFGSSFAWYQGLKMAIFDVTDVSNPVEMHKIVIGDRGTDSEALQDHKAFLFDRGKNLMVLPVLLAEIEDKETADKWSYGEYVYQGAYVYDVTLEDGFVLKGRVTHYDGEEPFMKSGYYFGDYGMRIKRSLYIGDVLYTISGSMIKANSLSDLSELKALKIAG